MTCRLVASPDDAAPVSLAGQWRFRLDPHAEGIAADWFRTTLPDTIELPGSCAQRGYGTKPAAPSVGRLTPALRYDGLAWYQRDLDIPPTWQGSTSKFSWNASSGKATRGSTTGPWASATVFRRRTGTT